MADDQTPAARDWRDTLFLPDTAFPMRAGLPQKEPEILARWEAEGLYGQIRAARADAPKFVFHDGPPYANGAIHLGHALNKTLKDLVVRTRSAMGFDTDFIPGWDCHGLPIEWKVEEEFRARGQKKQDVDPVTFRKACRAYADKWIPLQLEEFRRLGVCADWSAPYTTMAPAAEAAIAAEFLKVVEQGLVYRGSKPVMWSPVERTSLAEAEVEYEEKVSPTIWVKFPLVSGGPAAASVVIWTTTPWTIPANRAISFSPDIAYGVFEVTALEAGLAFEPWVKVGERVILADRLAEEALRAAKASSWTRVADFDPTGVVCAHPLRSWDGRGDGYGFPVPLLAGDHVTDDAGTGFVHTAPSHGADDFAIWTRSYGQEGIPFTVDEEGRFTREAPGFEGLEILQLEGKSTGKDGPANKAVIDALIASGNLMARGQLRHSYPHSWRSKAPLIFRNTPQWFIALDRPMQDGRTLRETALAEIERVDWGTEAARNRIRAMVADRPDWLVSRQRSWGVPLAMFVHRETGNILRDPGVNARIIAAMEKGGADVWWETPAQDFLGPDHDAAAYEKVEDILDVWFDSGCTHAFVLGQRASAPWPADMYLEGSDQHRGWFQSSLLQSCATRGRAPYNVVRTHGFTLDEQGRKQSKSLGNVVEPQKVIGQSGADVLRLAIAQFDYEDDQRFGKTVLDQASETYRKLRNTLRYLLGATSGFTDDERLPDGAEWPLLERWLRHRLHEVDAAVRQGWEGYDFRTALQAIVEFCNVDLSAFYVDVRKDSLYCDRPDAVRRRACRTALDAVFDRLTVWLAPYLPFTAEEAWTMRSAQAGSVHLRTLGHPLDGWADPAAAERMTLIRRVRAVVTGALEIERREKRIGASLEAAPIVHITDAGLRASVEGTDFADLCIVSDLTISTAPAPDEAFRLPGEPAVAVVPARAAGQRCARSWRVTRDVGSDPRFPELSARDADAVAWLEARGRA
jgi:isoleucyl-tRNA synthetase